ncbi:MAG: hypothetical protein ACREUQ_00535 [Burkholderiales bacterium]
MSKLLRSAPNKFANSYFVPVPNQLIYSDTDNAELRKLGGNLLAAGSGKRNGRCLTG